MRRLSILLQLSWQLLRLRFFDHQHEPHASKRLLFDTFRHLGGVYVKFLQILTLNVDFLRGWAGPAEFEVFEAVDYETINLPSTLAKAVPNYQQVFRSVNLQPFAAGSFAQVYLAELQDGNQVVLKVLRPSLVRHLNGDLRLLNFIIRLSSFLYPQSLVNIGDIFRQFAATVRAETDYNREVSNAAWFYKYFSSSDQIVIPRTYGELSNDQVIVQDYVGGLSLAKVLEAKKAGQNAAHIVKNQLNSDLWNQLEAVGTEILSASVMADFVLGDPHPGNIKLLADNKVGLIDFGVAAPAPTNRLAFLGLIREYEKLYANAFDPGEYLLAAFKFFDEELLEALTIASRYISPTEPDAMLQTLKRSAVEILAANESDHKTQQFLKRKMMGQLFTQTINEHNRFGVSLSIESGVMMKSATTYLSMLANLSDDGENFTTIHNAILRTLARADAASIQERSKSTISTERAFEMTSSWLANVADRDPFLYQQIAASISI
jgi:hypothetical protein